MTVFAYGPSVRRIAGPGDLDDVGSGWTIVLGGSPGWERDFGVWAPALGSAALRGASIEWRRP